MTENGRCRNWKSSLQGDGPCGDRHVLVGELIRDIVGMPYFDTEFLRRAVVDLSPLAWMIEVDGLLLDARTLNLELQLVAYQRRLIPYVPALDAGDG